MNRPFISFEGRLVRVKTGYASESEEPRDSEQTAEPPLCKGASTITSASRLSSPPHAAFGLGHVARYAFPRPALPATTSPARES